eukprot:CAMPEP_0178397876 /NCGR_PEP_ID=MMETSP0689_2-20121128/14480_1 /TAXON_ID=160604 /ORGANISM="Amphidinium massartii, Strain CS-259" /LENGTH=124 /DNA_ID=CAMNT_0020018615 /DNA_START=589 /DNA_END=959 /DNA_ORIENTATION=+
MAHSAAATSRQGLLPPAPLAATPRQQRSRGSKDHWCGCTMWPPQRRDAFQACPKVLPPRAALERTCRALWCLQCFHLLSWLLPQHQQQDRGVSSPMWTHQSHGKQQRRHSQCASTRHATNSQAS